MFNTLHDGAKLEMPADGTSMMPFILPHSTITIEKCQSYKIDDIIVFQTTNHQSIISHRIIYIDDKFFIAQGDSLVEPDAKCPIENIMGLVTQVKHKRFSYRTTSVLARCYGKMIRHFSPLSHRICRKSVSFGRAFKRLLQKIHLYK